MHVTSVRAAARLLTVPMVAGVALTVPAHAAEAAPAAAPTTSVAAVAPAAAAPAPAAVTLTPAQARLAIRAKRAARLRVMRHKVIKAARTRIGKPYRYGATGPNAFDCSGFVRWAYRAIGKDLPRTSGGIAGVVTRVRDPRPGDLVFFTRGSHVYHVGIYMSGHRVLHAQRPGTPVGTTRIWTRSVFYGRAA